MDEYEYCLEEFWPDMSIETCPYCDGNSGPIDDIFYCGKCQGRGWIYAQMFDSPYLSCFEIEQWHKEWLNKKETTDGN